MEERNQWWWLYIHPAPILSSFINKNNSTNNDSSNNNYSSNNQSAMDHVVHNCRSFWTWVSVGAFWLPFRAGFFLVGVPLWYGALRAACCLPWFARSHGPRRIVAWGARWLLGALGVVRLRVRGRVDPAAPTLVANHVSLLDPLVLLAAVGPCSFVCREGVSSVPVVGFLSRTLDCVYVRSALEDPRSIPVQEGRDGQDANGDVLVEQGGAWSRGAARLRQRSEETGAGGTPVVVFPEGTTSNGRAVARFRTGAFLAQRPVQPVALRYGLLRGGHAASWESIPLPAFLWRLLTSSCLEVAVEFLPAVEAAPARSPADRAAAAQRAAADALGVPAVPASPSAKRALHRAIRAGELAWDSGQII